MTISKIVANSLGGNLTLTGNTAYTGTLTGGTGIINIGSGQFYKDANGNIGIGTSSPAFTLGSGVRIDRTGDTASLELSRTDGTAGSLLIAAASGSNTIRSYGVKPLTFLTDGSERMRIDSSGNLLVGQTSGSFKLSVTGTVYLDNRKSTSYNASSAATLGVFGASNDASVNNGAVYNIEWLMSGNASGQFWFANYIARGGSRTLGASCTGTTWTNASDIANKEDIAPIGYGLETVMATNPVDFRWKTMKGHDGFGKKDIGFIAQDMELIVPEVVTGDEGQKGISYGSLVAVAFKAIQEQQAIIEQLKARLDDANL
jgi:hypothetical protein